VVISFVAWLLAPILFSPFPRWRLIRQDIHEFSRFITGGAGTEDLEINEVISRGKGGKVRSLYECGLADEMIFWTESPLFMTGIFFLVKLALGGYLVFALPAEILDFLPVFLVALSFSWVIVLGNFVVGMNNLFLVLSFLTWPATLPLAHYIIGSRFSSPTVWTRLPEYVISLAVFLYLLSLVKELVLILCRVLHSFSTRCCKSGPGRLHHSIKVCFVYFLVHQKNIAEAYVILFGNAVFSLFLAVVDMVFCNAHTWFMLNNELAQTKHSERYMENKATFFELDDWIWSTDSDSDRTPRDLETTDAFS